MKAALIAMGLFFGVLILGGVTVGVMWYSNYTSAVDHEAGLEAQLKVNQSKMSEMLQTARETFGVTKAYEKGFNNMMRSALEGRAADGGGSLAKFLTEAYPGTFDSSLYTRVQDVITAKRAEFAMYQETMASKVQSYERELKYPVSGLFMRMSGFPTNPLDKYKVVVSEDAAEAFETGTDKGITFE